MENKSTSFYNHILYMLVPLIILVGIISYDRIIVNHDYVVGYEGVCNPETNSCFSGCEDAECSVSYYYSKMRKYEPDLYSQCGKDITDCEEASICLSTDRDCSIIYCDAEVEKEGSCSILNSNEIDVQNNIEDNYVNQ